MVNEIINVSDGNLQIESNESMIPCAVKQYWKSWARVQENNIKVIITTIKSLHDYKVSKEWTSITLNFYTSKQKITILTF